MNDEIAQAWAELRAGMRDLIEKYPPKFVAHCNTCKCGGEQ
jgi:hypothetical protein